MLLRVRSNWCVCVCVCVCCQVSQLTCETVTTKVPLKGESSPNDTRNRSDMLIAAGEGASVRKQKVCIVFQTYNLKLVWMSFRLSFHDFSFDRANLHKIFLRQAVFNCSFLRSFLHENIMFSTQKKMFTTRKIGFFSHELFCKSWCPT